MDRSRIRAALGAQRAHCAARSPLYAAVLEELERDAASSPPWLARAEQAWRGRRFAVDWEVAHLLLAGAHRAALAGEAPELAALYPSCGGSGGAPRGAARGFLARAGGEFWERLAHAKVQTNEVGRSAAWMLGAAAGLPADLPFHLVELGASAGLNLVGDYLEHDCAFASPAGGRVEPPRGWQRRPQPAISRTGLDLEPRRLAAPEDRLWLKACVWADDLPRLERLERAARVFLVLKDRNAAPRLERCSFREAPRWLAGELPARPGEGLAVFNSIATVYLDEAGYEELKLGMAAALAPWGERGLWIEYERSRGAAAGPLELRVHRLAGGELRTRVLATGAPRPTEFRVLDGWGADGGATSMR